MRQRSSAAHGEPVRKRVEPGQALSRQPVSQRRPARAVHACGTVICSCAAPSSRRPRETGPTSCTGRTGAAATSTAPTRPTIAGIPTPRQHHDHNELQLP